MFFPVLVSLKSLALLCKPPSAATTTPKRCCRSSEVHLSFQILYHKPLVTSILPTGLALSDVCREQILKWSVIEQLVHLVTSSSHDGALVEACTCMANLSFRSIPQLPNVLLPLHPDIFRSLEIRNSLGKSGAIPPLMWLIRNRSSLKPHLFHPSKSPRIIIHIIKAVSRRLF
jgi:hypothetical protein